MDVVAVPMALPSRSALARIVALTDFTPASTPGVRCAAMLAGIHSARSLRLLDVVGPHDFHPDAPMVVDMTDEMLALQRTSGRVPVPPTVVVRDGASLVDTTLAELEEMSADLLVVTLGRRGWLDDKLLSLLRRVPVDVLCVSAAVAPRWPEQPARVLVGVDFSDASRRALTLANRLSDAPVIAAHVVDYRAEPSTDASGVSTPFASDPFLPTRLRTRVTSWAGSLADEVRIAQGEVPDRLLAIASEEGAGLIVLGKDGLRNRREPAHGRVPERVLAESTIPALLVR